MTINEFVQLTKGENISRFDPQYSIGEWVEHVFTHYGTLHRLDSLNVYGITHKEDRHSVNTRYTEFKDEKYILIDERYIDNIMQIAESIVTGWVPLLEALCYSPQFIQEYNSRKKFNIGPEDGINLYPEFGLPWNEMDEDELTQLIREIIMKFMIAHEIHHVLIDNGLITDENIKYDFKVSVGFDAIDDAIEYINNDPSFTKRFSDKQLLTELCCDKHAVDLTWRDIMFSRGECNPLIFSTAIILTFSAMKFHYAEYQQGNTEANIDIQIRDLYAQALCTVYCDRFIYVATIDQPREDRIALLRAITPYYEQFALILHDLSLCYYSLLCKTLNDYGFISDFKKIALNYVLLHIDNKLAATYRNENFEVNNNMALSIYIDRALAIYDGIYKRTPFYKTSYYITEESSKYSIQNLFGDLDARNEFITTFNALKNL